MPRLSRKKPTYRKHIRGQALVVLNGQYHYLGKYGTKESKDAYNRLIREWQANGGVLPSKRYETVVELCADYLNHCATYYVKNGKQTGEVHCVRSALRNLCQSYGRVAVSQLGPLSLEAVRHSMIESGLTRSFINKSVNRMRRCFKWGVSKERVPAEVYQALMSIDGLKAGRTIAKEPKPVLPVADDVSELTAKHSAKPVDEMIRLQRLIGCRPGELCQMKPCEIDRTGAVWLYRPASHKMEHKGRGRVIAIGPKAQRLLIPFLNGEPNQFCFLRRCRKPFERWHYSQAINAGCDRAYPAPEGLSAEQLKTWKKKHRWAPNQLRHAAATEIRAEFGLEAAQVSLGHSNANVTQVYAERDLAKAIEVAKTR